MRLFLSDILPALVLVVSLASLIVTVCDKIAAIRGKRRVRENTLMLLAACGGSVVMLLTMLLIRHKTRHVKFMLGIPIIIVFQIIVVMWLYSRFA